MSEPWKPTVSEALCSRAVGQETLNFVKSRGEDIGETVKDEALELLEKIRAILDDPQCFRRIEAIVDAFSDAGIPTARHDW